MNVINTWPGWENAGLLGEGSFGNVYRIRREEYGAVREAALKVIGIPSSQAELTAAREEGMDASGIANYFKSFVEDLTAELALMSSLKGGINIVNYEDYMVIPREGEVGWDILIRMELLRPLLAAAAERPLTEADVAVLGMDMCRALALCRNRGILHRDIKPENIFVSREGNYKLGGFGVARLAEKTVSAMSRKGTYSFMAPEVYKREEYGFGADIYSLGIVLYRYLNNGRLPFLPPYPEPVRYSDGERALVRRMEGEKLPPPANGSEALRRAVLKACEYRAEDRYDSAESFLADLAGVLYAWGYTEGYAGNANRFRPYAEAVPPAEEADEFDRTMSAVALGRLEAAMAEAAGAGPNEAAHHNETARYNEALHPNEATYYDENGEGRGMKLRSGGKKGGLRKKIIAAVGAIAAGVLVLIGIAGKMSVLVAIAGLLALVLLIFIIKYHADS